MIRMSKGPKGETLQAVVIVAFDPSSGRVHGSFVHGSHGGPDEAGIERSRERFLGELRRRVGSVSLDVLQYPLDDLKGGWAERVDLETRKLVTRSDDARYA